VNGEPFRERMMDGFFYGGAVQDTILKPSIAQLKYSEAELGVIIHLDLEIYKPEIFWKDYMGKEKITKALPLSLFNPKKLNTDDWIRAVKEMGGKYAILVAKHTSGFSLWPTTAHSYNVANTPWKGGKGDIVAEFIASCNKYGILPGIYCSYAGNAYFNVDGGRVQHGSEAEFRSLIASRWIKFA
jgi:alpha-L-fucosidase